MLSAVCLSCLSASICSQHAFVTFMSHIPLYSRGNLPLTDPPRAWADDSSLTDYRFTVPHDSIIKGKYDIFLAAHGS